MFAAKRNCAAEVVLIMKHRDDSARATVYGTETAVAGCSVSR